MTFTTPASVSPGDKYNASAHNIVVSDLVDLDSRVSTVSVYTAPVGSIMTYIALTAPTGWLLCNGNQVSQGLYPALYALIGVNKFGTDTGGNFYLPDLRGRIPIGIGTNADVDVIGDNEAGNAVAGLSSAVADRRAKHKHTVTDPGHTHTVQQLTSGVDAGPDGAVAKYASYTNAFYGNTHSVTTNATNITVGLQTNVPTDGPAFLTLNFIIKT